MKVPAGIDVITSLSSIPAAEWNRLVQADDPFAEHAFLSALERSGSVGPGTGWSPAHIVLRTPKGQLRAALPLYLKQHSYGEYIFDWSWAAAAQRAGIRYYPKLVSMAPLTPATGQRILLGEDEALSSVVPALLAGARGLSDEIGASSIHLLFLSETERDAIAAAGKDFLPRLSMQFHWHNRGYENFEQYLGALRSPLRKQVRKERARARSTGLTIKTLTGAELTQREYDALWTFYTDTCHKRGSGPYLTERFFKELVDMDPNRVLAVLAYDGETPVAGTLNFQKGKRLYGRYWGCLQDYDALHFECCYYQLIERAIDRGMDHFEAGAQGMHKLRRGLLPAAIHSAHHISHPGLRAAVAEFLPAEAFAVEQEMETLAHHGPFKRDGEGPQHDRQDSSPDSR